MVLSYGRDRASLRLDIQDAAEEFVEVLSEFAADPWEPQDIAELANALAAKAIKVLDDPEQRF